jgi:hypothetical protein
MDLEIESLLFKQVPKPKHHLMTKIINVFDNRYRINVYVQIEEDGFLKRTIANSYFAHYVKGKLTIIPDGDKKNEESLKNHA